ncbi:site-specific DNA-methyltransferase [Curvibacter sp. HBC61]|uniref:Methyltransferase n=1 Tax=Curvibacter cyanobacteriorum TaxID=3026422 RepID=A0ABT5MUZ6_9BURK|nr:site-specific DNA-methyltransferase [Curvibacter sp. HBC61]MDD0837867.1 site-specific DNA-methyltransferase [Curvibacter sp. HBC61]
MHWINKCHFGDVRDVLTNMISDGVKVNTIVTSPPYWGLRDYGVDGQIGLEPTFPEFLATMTEVFDLARQVLRDDGTAWVNMGDSYVGNRGAAWGPSPSSQAAREKTMTASRRRDKLAIPRSDVRVEGLKPKDLVGQPWRLAFALQDAGWWLRSDIIWHKPNPMPESCKDRPTKAHEYLFLLSKSEQYFFDFEAFQEPVSGTAHGRGRREFPDGWASGPGTHHAIGHNTPKAKASTGVGFGRGYDKAPKPRVKNNMSMDSALREAPTMRNRRTVWTIPTQAYAGAHFATFPEALVEPCILAGCPVGGTVLDIFFGTGTTGQVAQRLGRNWIGIDLNRANEPLQAERLRQPGLALEAA